MTHKVPVQYRPATTTRNTATSFLRKGQLNRLVKGSVESTHKVPTSHILRKGQLNRDTQGTDQPTSCSSSRSFSIPARRTTTGSGTSSKLGLTKRSLSCTRSKMTCFDYIKPCQRRCRHTSYRTSHTRTRIVLPIERREPIQLPHFQTRFISNANACANDAREQR